MAGKNFSFNFIINGNVNSSLINSFGKVGTAIQRINIQAQDLKASFNLANNAFKNGAITADTYAARMRELGAARRALAQSAMTAQSGNFFLAANNLQSTLATAGRLAAPFVNATKTAMSFEAAISKVRAITVATDTETKQLSATARELGEKTQYTASQAADAMSYLGMAGWKTEQIIAGMPGLLNLAAAGGTDLARTADIVSDDLTAFGLAAKDAGHMADVYAVTITKTNTNVEMLGETMKYAAPVAHAFGVSLEETAALTGMMANSGIKASQAGTALRAGFLRLAGPPKMAANALAELGLTAQDLTAEQKEATMALESLGIKAGNVEGPQKMAHILKELKEKMAGLSQEQQLATAKAIFGTEAASGWLAVLNSAPGTFEQLVEAIQNSNGAAETMAQTMKNNGAGALERFKSAQESLSISIGNAFLPSLTKALNGLAGYTGRLSQFAGEHTTAAMVITGFGAVIGGVVIGLQALGTAYQGMLAIGAMYRVLTASSIATTIAHTTALAGKNAMMIAGAICTKSLAVAQWALNAAMTANPIGLVIAGIAALIAIGYVLYQNWDTISAFASTMWEGGKQAIANFGETIMNKISSICDTVTQKWQSLKDFLSHPIDTLVRYNQSLSGGGEVAQNAEGGIYGKGAFLTTFAEESPEAAIPLDGSARAVSLWERAGDALGVGGRGAISVNYSPRVTIQGNADQGTVERALSISHRELERMLAEISTDRRRLSYE